MKTAFFTTSTRYTLGVLFVGAFCCNVTPLSAAPKTQSPKSQTPQSAAKPLTPLTADQKVLHALNRLAFGPRTGDV